MTPRIIHSLAIWLIVLIISAVGAIGCGGGEVVDDEPPTEGPVVYEDGPDAQQLADAPCGEPDWSEPPPDIVPLKDAEN